MRPQRTEHSRAPLCRNIGFGRNQHFYISARAVCRMFSPKQIRFPVSLQLDFWINPSSTARPVDVRIPAASVQSVKAFLDSQGIEYSILIEDLQVGSASGTHFLHLLETPVPNVASFPLFHTLFSVGSCPYFCRLWINPSRTIHGSLQVFSE